MARQNGSKDHVIEDAETEVLSPGEATSILQLQHQSLEQLLLALVSMQQT